MLDEVDFSRIDQNYSVVPEVRIPVSSPDRNATTEHAEKNSVR